MVKGEAAAGVNPPCGGCAGRQIRAGIWRAGQAGQRGSQAGAGDRARACSAFQAASSCMQVSYAWVSTESIVCVGVELAEAVEFRVHIQP